MSVIKRHIEDDDAKRATAVFILTKVGILKSCDSHDDVIYQSGVGDIQEAYKFGNAHWADFSSLFKDRRELTDKILEISRDADYGNDGCEACRSQWKKD